MAFAIAIGNVVWLKSGGPAMTVMSINQEGGRGRASLSWFDRNLIVHTALRVPIECLTLTLNPPKQNNKRRKV